MKNIVLVLAMMFATVSVYAVNTGDAVKQKENHNSNEKKAAKIIHIDKYGNIYFVDSLEKLKKINEVELSLRNGLEFFQKKQYNEAIKHLHHAALYYNTKALYALGYCYTYGLGTKRDFAKAEKYLLEAIKGTPSMPYAIEILGNLYLQQASYSKSSKDKISLILQSSSCYQKAAEKGNVKSQAVIAEFYFGAWERVFPTINFKKIIDYKKAFYWYKKAAENGDVNAQWGLGDMYERGLGTESNIDKAKEWYQKAAQQGDVRGRMSLERLSK